MNAHEYLTDDGQALLAVCSSFALPPDAEARGLVPFKLSEWNALWTRVSASAGHGPSELHGKSPEHLARELGITLDEGERLARLLERCGQIAPDLDALFSRGMWAVTQADPLYPARLRESLRHHAPMVLFGAGDIALLQRPGLGVVGSRNIDEAGALFARNAGARAVRSGMAVVSGGARGTDRIAMDGAMEADGVALGALADSLEATLRKSDVQEFVRDGRLLLLTPYAPHAGFSVGAAMGRNKIIYGLSEFALVVSSEVETGGTWSGAVEALKTGSCPVFVRTGESVPKGNSALLKRGAIALGEQDLAEVENLREWLAARAVRPAREQELF